MKKGWCVLTDTVSGPELIWRTVDDNNEDVPQIFESEKAAQDEIAEDIISDLQEFIAGDRDWDEIHQFDEYTVALIEISEQGVITVYDAENKMMEVTLKQWRENL